MPALITINQATKPPGTPGKSRDQFDAGLLVTCSNDTAEGSYLWTLVDAPIRSALVRGTTGVASTFTFTPDVKGTYLVSLTVNGSPFPVDFDESFAAVLTSGLKTLGWRYLAAREQEDADNINKPGLGFPGNTNVRGWATDRDLQLEQTEDAVYEVLNRVLTSPGIGADNLAQLDPLTGKFDPSVVPASAGGSPNSFVGALNEVENVLNVPRVLGGFKVDGDDLGVGRTYQFALVGQYLATTGAGDAKLYLYDMGAPAAGPAAGTLRSTLTISAPTSNRIHATINTLTAVPVPGINVNEISEDVRKYEVRSELVSAAAGDKMTVLWGGVIGV